MMRWWLVLAMLALSAEAGGAQPVVPLPGQTGQDAASERREGAWETFGDADFAWLIQELEGDTLTLERLRGEVLFINLWASWCIPCIRELGSIERLRARLADTEVRFLIVAAESERPVRRFLRRYRYDLPFYLERTPLPPSFGLRGLPTTWLVDRDGGIALLRHGEAVWDTDAVEAFVRAVARVRDESEPPPE